VRRTAITIKRILSHNISVSVYGMENVAVSQLDKGRVPFSQI
jgi:hypothetical protein